jgi:hypothetical protein
MEVHIRRGNKLNRNDVFREERKPQAFRKTTDNDSHFHNFLDHAETEGGSSFEISEDIHLSRFALC